MFINVRQKFLGDGSPVYDVEIGEKVWQAVTATDAENLAYKLRDAIMEHTIIQPFVSFNY